MVTEANLEALSLDKETFDRLDKTVKGLCSFCKDTDQACKNCERVYDAMLGSYLDGYKSGFTEGCEALSDFIIDKATSA